MGNETSLNATDTCGDPVTWQDRMQVVSFTLCSGAFWCLLQKLLVLLAFVKRRISGTSPFISAYTYHTNTFTE